MKYFIPLLIPLIINCKNLSDANIRPADPTFQWMSAINKSKPGEVYSEKSLKIDTSTMAIEGSSNIIEYYSLHPIKIKEVKSIFRIYATKDSSFIYEITDVKTDEELKQINIWKKVNEEWKKEFEYMLPSSTAVIDQKALAARRSEWITLCNLHRADSLVHSLYAVHAIYFNHKPAIKGRNLITKEYAYMNNLMYNLTLQPMHIEVVNENTVFEIGQGIGSYVGKYIIVWRKNSLGIWEVLIDSNI